LLRRWEQPFTDFVIRKNNELNEKMENLASNVSFSEILSVNILSLLPEILFSSLSKNLSQLHLCLFFIWGKYYDVAKRLTGITYKYEQGLEGSHGISYLRPGRFIMLTLLI
jgi:chloramphenicol O-acetyltransferase